MHVNADNVKKDLTQLQSEETPHYEICRQCDKKGIFELLSEET